MTAMLKRFKITWRFYEAALLGLIFIAGGVGFVSAAAAEAYRQGQDPRLLIAPALIPVAIIGLCFIIPHTALSLRKVSFDQLMLPITALIFCIGMTMIWRLRGSDGILQQITRGLVPGMLICTVLVSWSPLIDYVRRYAVAIGLAGLGLLFLTGLFGVQDETGARLALKLGPLPSVQTSEMIKIALIIFMAWYIDREGRAAEGRAMNFLWFRLPSVRYIAPAAMFIGAATLALVAMSDFGAVPILGALFIAMLFAGFDTRIFITITVFGLVMGVIVGLVLAQTWDLPATIQYRYLAFQNPWSTQMMPNGYTIAEGPGYQIQQALYAVIAGGVTGTGLGMGNPTFIPLAHSDFILAAIIEEMGSAVGIALLVLYAILVLRIFRVVLLLPRGQVFERMLLIGIGVHLFTQAFIMAGGTFDLFPLTGVTLPFLSMGGVSLMVNLIEIGFALTLMQRIDKRPA